MGMEIKKQKRTHVSASLDISYGRGGHCREGTDCLSVREPAFWIQEDRIATETPGESQIQSESMCWAAVTFLRVE